MNSTLLVEIGCEELPYKVCESVLRQLEGTPEAPGLALGLLGEERLLEEGATARVLISPRRIAVLVTGVPTLQLPKVQEFRGPKAEIAYAADGTLTKAGAGFARSKDAAAEDVRREVVDGTEFVVVSVEAGRRAAARRRAGARRPAHHRPADPARHALGRGARGRERLPALLAPHPLAGRQARRRDAQRVAFYGLPLGDVSQGHRVLGAPVAIAAAGDYERLLEEQKVVVSQAERRRLIAEGLDARAAELGGEWSDPGDVLAEAVYLAEWPSVAGGAFAERHLRLPDEVLVTAMQSHQRYFPVRDAGGGLLPAFLYVANGDPAAAPLVTRGNERVLDGRLDDAEFAYDRDLAEGLPAMADRLGAVVFHEKLGSLADKANRLGGLVAGLAAGAAGGAAGDNGSSAPLAETLRDRGAPRQGRPRQPGRHRVPRAAGRHGRALRRGRRPRRRGGQRRRRALPAAVGDGAAAGHRRRRLARRGRQGRQHRRRLGRRREAVRLARPLRAAPRRHGHRAHRSRVQPALPAHRPARLGGRPVRAAGHRGPGRRRRDAIVDETAAFVRERLQVLLLDEGLPFPSVEAAMGAAGRRPAGAGRAGAHLRGARRPRRLRGRRHRLQPLLGAGGQGRRTPGRAPSTRRSSATTPSASWPRPSRPRAGRCSTRSGNLELESAIAVAAGLRPAVDRYFDAVLVMDPDAAVRANRLAQLAAVSGLIGRIGEFSRLPLTQA